jgi:hypothetical protein
MAKKASVIETATQSVELLAKTLLLVTGACYVLGLIVVNIHLGGYGVYSLSLLQLNYVTAGIWTLLPVILAVIVFSFAFSGRKQFDFLSPDEKAATGTIAQAEKVAVERHDVKEHLSDPENVEPTARVNSRSETENAGAKPKQKNILRLMGQVLALAAAAGGAFVGGRFALGLLGGYLGFSFGLSWLWALLLGGPAVFLLLVCFFGWFGFTKSGRSANLGELSGAVITTSIAIGLFLFYLAFFARGPFTEIPSGLGGGQPDEVSFIVDPATKPYLEAEKLLQFPSNSTRSEPVELILATDREYVFLSAGTAVSIRNESVKAVLHQKK